jgi:hypothetical protein
MSNTSLQAVHLQVTGKYSDRVCVCKLCCRLSVMEVQITAVARQWLSSDHMGTPTDTYATMVQQQRNGVICEVRAEML